MTCGWHWRHVVPCTHHGVDELAEERGPVSGDSLVHEAHLDKGPSTREKLCPPTVVSGSNLYGVTSSCIVLGSPVMSVSNGWEGKMGVGAVSNAGALAGTNAGIGAGA